VPQHDGTDDGNEQPKPSLGERLRAAFLKPAEPTETPAPVAKPLSVEELEAKVKRADDKERAIGLIAAPLAALIGILVISAVLRDNPPALLHGHPNKLHVNPSTYHQLAVVLVVLTVLILVMALWRKRMLLGVTMALFGLAIFDLHYWGFGVPFILAGSWLFVRAYRLNQQLKDATSGSSPANGKAKGTGAETPGRPTPSKRYTPPRAQPKKPGATKPPDEQGKQQKAG